VRVGCGHIVKQRTSCGYRRIGYGDTSCVSLRLGGGEGGGGGEGRHEPHTPLSTLVAEMATKPPARVLHQCSGPSGTGGLVGRAASCGQEFCLSWATKHTHTHMHAHTYTHELTKNTDTHKQVVKESPTAYSH
jgi:hypothetical protein